MRLSGRRAHDAACDLRTSGRSRGQTLAEFAIVIPVVMALVGGIIQFGLIFWAQNTLTQTVRDVGRWEATQRADCSVTGDRTTAVANLGTQAESIASTSSLFGYQAGEFGSPSDKTSDATPDSTVNAFPLSSGTGNIAVAWVHDSGSGTICPAVSNTDVWHVTIKMNQQIPTFFPGMQYLPGLGTCDSAGCRVTVSSTAVYRMEPAGE